MDKGVVGQRWGAESTLTAQVECVEGGRRSLWVTVASGHVVVVVQMWGGLTITMVSRHRHRLCVHGSSWSHWRMRGARMHAGCGVDEGDGVGVDGTGGVRGGRRLLWLGNPDHREPPCRVCHRGYI